MDLQNEGIEKNVNNYPEKPLDLNLPMVQSGPHRSKTPIDVPAKKKKNTQELGQDDVVVTTRVVGGQGVNPRSYYAMLLYKDSAGWKFAGCGATLITNCHVITAAHCVEDRNFDIEGIYNNAHTPYNGNSNHPFHFTTAKRIFVPQEYDDYTNVNDIAVIRMSQCLNLTEYPPAIPASPYTNKVQSGNMLELYGFGRLGENVGQSGDTKQIQMARLPYITNNQCKNYFGNKIKYGMFCAGYPQGGIDACQGDSGSGIFWNSVNPKNQATLMGVVSWGVGCARKGYPGVYAKVEDFYEWIKTNVCHDADLDSSIKWCKDVTNQKNALMLRQADCKQNYQCDACEGECKNDQQCSGSLQCFERTQNKPFALIPGCLGTGVATRNYCYDPNLARFADNYNNQSQNQIKNSQQHSRNNNVRGNHWRNPNIERRQNNRRRREGNARK